MHRHRRFLIGSLLLLVPALVTVIACQSYAMGQMAARPTAVGTIDLDRVFEGVNRRADIDARLKAMAEELQSQGDRLADEIDSLQEEVEAYTPGSDMHQQTMEKLQLKSLQYQAFAEFSNRKLEVHKALELRRLFEDVRSAVEVLAVDLGYDIVLVDDSGSPISGGTESDVRLQILAKQVLFAGADVDLTDALIQALNQP